MAIITSAAGPDFNTNKIPIHPIHSAIHFIEDASHAHISLNFAQRHIFYLTMRSSLSFHSRLHYVHTVQWSWYKNFYSPTLTLNNK